MKAEKVQLFTPIKDEEEPGLDIAQIIVADVTRDPDELNISSLDENSAKD